MKGGMNKTWENGVVSGVGLKNGRTGRLGSVLRVMYLLVILVLASMAQADEMTPGKTFRDCDKCPDLVVVTAGRFQMGDLSGHDDERPVHEVTISRPFAVGKYEVTKGEFAHFVEATGYGTGNTCWVWNKEEKKAEERAGIGWRNPGFSQTDRHPVTCVNWHDAQAYMEWLSRKTGNFYRLLSEAEWEYVTRAGTTTRWYWGESESGQCHYANGADLQAKKHNSNWVVAECDDGYYQTSPVGNFKANAFGVFDTAGNVWEWVEDCWNDNYQGAPADGRAWTSGDCGQRVLRGGSWSSNPGSVRPALRDWNDPGSRLNNYGFRIARTLTP